MVKSIQQWSDFQMAMANGRQLKSPHFVLHHWQTSCESLTGPELTSAPALFIDRHLGVVVPKRLAKKAVTRNLIRRQAKDIWQRMHEKLPSAVYVVRLKAAFSGHDFASASSVRLRQAVRAELTQLVDQIQTQAQK